MLVAVQVAVQPSPVTITICLKFRLKFRLDHFLRTLRFRFATAVKPAASLKFRACPQKMGDGQASRSLQPILSPLQAQGLSCTPTRWFSRHAQPPCTRAVCNKSAGIMETRT